jgi:hypothetical protein
MRLIQNIEIDPDDTIWKAQIKVDLDDFISQRKCKDAICDISKFLSPPLFKLFVHNYQLQFDLAWFLPQLKRIIWDFWGQLQSGSDLYFITGILFSMIHLISYTILGTIWNVIEDMQGLCQGPLSLYNAVFPIILHHLMLSLLNIFLTFSILLNFLTVDMENLNINENTIGGRNYVDPDTISSDELLALCLVGSLLSDKPVKFHVMKERLATIWRPGQGVSISAMEENKFLFQFYHLWDMERVFQGGPWLFDNHMLVLKKLSVGDDPLAINLDVVEMWVQVFNLPFGFMNDTMGLLIGSHIGRFVKYDDYNNHGSWRMYMRIRVAVKVDEPLKKSFTFEKEDGGVVHVHFKYEKLGVFCFVCGILGHTESFCHKRLEPGFVEGEKGWGNFLKSGNTSIGGGVTINKWLRDGKSQNRVGRSGGTRAYAGTDGRSTMTGTEAVGINVGQPIQHALFGRVKVVRDERRRCLTFQTAIANPMTKVASYDEGVQWVPFTINSETLARPFVHSAIGQRILLERRNDITHLLQADPVNTVTSSALVVSNSTAVSAGHMVETGVVSVEFTQNATAAVGLVGKAATVPKKRMRINSEGNNEEAEVEHTMGEGPDVMKVDEHNEGFNAAVRAIPMQTNPLFVDKIVMASSGFQNRQPK